MDEINKFDADKTEEERASVAEYKKTSMKEPVALFETFLKGLAKENIAKRRDENGELFPIIFF